MHLSKLDFSAHRTHFTPAATLLLLTGILLAGSFTVEAVDTLAQRDNAQEKRVQLAARAAELRGIKAPPARAATKDAGRGGSASDDTEARRIAEAQTVISALATPWNDMFDALEAAQDDTVALLTIAPERAAGRLAMTGEAKNYEAMIAYLARLDDSGGLIHAQLLAHEVKGSDRHVFFSANASFRQ